MKLIFFHILIFILILPVALFSQSEERLEIVPTDSTDMKQTRTDQGILVELVGNVHLRQGKAEMFCKHVKWWKDAGEVIIEKDVEIYDGTKKLTADTVFYYTDTKIYKAFGNVVLEDSIHQITADRLFYFKSEDKVAADGNVILIDFENNVDIFSGHAELDNEKDYVVITIDPVLIRNDSTGNEDIRITGQKMELFDGGNKAVITDSVHITQKDASTTCGLAEFYREKNEIKEPNIK